MNDYAHQQMVRAAVKKKFGSHKVLLSKHSARYPEQAEREFQRVTNAYMKLLNEKLKKYLPKIKRAAEAEESKSQRHDSTADLIAEIQKIFNEMIFDLQKDVEGFPLYDRIEAMAKLTQKLSIAEWKKQVKATVGIDLADDYYNGDLLKQLLQKWVDNNIGLINTIPQASLNNMRNIVIESYQRGKPTRSIMKEIQRAYNISKSHARLIARDQIAKLNSEITRFQQEDAGITQYFWSTSRDGRVRDSHKALEGKRFSWNDPPIVDERTGRRCHPGEDYQCRCVALAVFDIDTLNIPMKESGGG